MRRVPLIIGIILVLLGIVWILQGSNVLAGSVMSGQSMWLWIGVAVAVVGLVTAGWSVTRR